MADARDKIDLCPASQPLSAVFRHRPLAVLYWPVCYTATWQAMNHGGLSANPCRNAGCDRMLPLLPLGAEPSHGLCCVACRHGSHTRHCDRSHRHRLRGVVSLCRTPGCSLRVQVGHTSCCSLCRQSLGSAHSSTCAGRQMVIATSLQATTAPIVTTAAAADTAAMAPTAVSPHAWITAMPQTGSAHSATVDSAGIQRNESPAMQGPAGDSPGRSTSTGEQATSSGSQTIPTPRTQGSYVVFLNDLDDEPMWLASDHAGPVMAESHDIDTEADGATSETSAADLDLFGMD